MSYHTIIVGLGAMGSAALYQLAKRNVRVLGLEQFMGLHQNGSYHGHTRMTRMAYYEHPHYVPLLRRAYELWHELEAEAKQKYLHLTGGIYMGPPTGHVVHGARESARLHNLPHEYLDRSAIARRFPQFNVPDDYAAVLEPNAGFLLSENIVGAHIWFSNIRGAGLRCQEPLLDWTATDAGVTVRTHRETYHAERLIICSGAWTGRILADLGLPLVVTRQILGWVFPDAPEPFAYGTLPVWGIEQPDGSLAYGFPWMPEQKTLKLARHGRGTPTDAETIDRTTHPEDEREIRDILTRYLPGAQGQIVNLQVCMYTNTPDSHFIIDRHPDHENVLLAAGFSGHGFKFASVVGEILADLAQNGRTSHPIDFLSMKRFARGARPSTEP